MKKPLNKKSSDKDNKKPKGEKKNLPIGFKLPKGMEIYHSTRPTTFDKIRAHYLEGKSLSPKLEGLKRVYEHTNSLLLDGYSRQEVVEMLKSTLPPTSQGHLYEIIRTTINLFGDVHENTKKGLRYILIDNQIKVYKRAVEAGDIREQNTALKNAAMFGGIMNSEDSFDFKTLILPVPVFSSNPEILKRQQTIDIDHEDE